MTKLNDGLFKRKRKKKKKKQYHQHKASSKCVVKQTDGYKCRYSTFIKTSVADDWWLANYTKLNQEMWCSKH